MIFNLANKDYKSEMYSAPVSGFENVHAVIRLRKHTFRPEWGWSIVYNWEYGTNFVTPNLFADDHLSRKEARTIAMRLMNEASPDDFDKFTAFHQREIKGIKRNPPDTKIMNINDINTTFNRPEYDETTYAMVRHLEAGGTLPPILVSPNGFLHDGRHRLAAYKIIGRENIVVQIDESGIRK